MLARARRSARSFLCTLFAAVLLPSCGGGGDSAAPPPAAVVANRAPQIGSTPASTAAVGTAYAYDAEAADPDGDALVYTLAEAPAGMTIDAASGLVAWSPSAAQVGNHAVTVRVSDRGGLAATQAYSIAVTMTAAPAAALRITSVPPAGAVAGTAYRYEVAVSATGDAGLAYRLVRAPEGMAIDAATGAVTWTPAAAQAGRHVVVVQVAGGAAGPEAQGATQEYTLEVSVGNAAPQVTSMPSTTAVAGLTYAFGLSAVDPNGDTLVYSLVQAPAGMTLDAASGALAWTPTAAQVGGHSVTVRAADPGGLAAQRTWSITVLAANAAPRITGTPVVAATAGLPYSYVVVASDPDGDTLTHALAQAPAGMSLQAASGVVTWTPTPAQAGVHSVTVRVSDPGGLTATQTFSITVVRPNAAPQFVVAPAAAAVVGVPWAHTVEARDPDGDGLTYTLTQAPAGMSLHATSGRLAWTPAPSQAGPQAVTVRAADAAGLAATLSLTVPVTVPNAAPVILSAPVVVATVGSAFAYDVDAVDPNGDALTHTLVQAPAGMSIQPGTGLVTWTPAYSQVGRQSVSVRVADPGGLAAVQSFDIVVGGDTRIDAATPATQTVDAGGPASITLHWVRVPMASHTLQFMHLVNAAGQSWSVDDHWTTSATWVAGAYSETRSITVPPGLPAGTYDVRVGLSGGSPWGNFALAAGSGVTDPAGDRRYRVAQLAVVSRAPQVTSTPVTSAAVGTAYLYDVDATDPDAGPAGGALTYTLAQAPAGMAIQAGTGVVTWTPTAAQRGPHTVSVRVADAGGFTSTQTYTVTVEAEPALGPMMMACADGAGWQCSGESVLRVEHGVAVTRSGVQVYGRSTSDMAPTNPNLSSAFGLAPASGGVAEIRIRKDGNAAPDDVAMLLSNLAIYWSGTTNRPQIIETFNPTAGRVYLDGGGALRFAGLPPSADLGWYDYASLGVAATRANYANNRYFPRADPPRCVPGGWCATYETTGPQFGGGSWRWGGLDPDRVNASRNHEDGDVHAGNGPPDGNGNPTWLAGGTGLGVPMPGSKGYRMIDHWSYRHGNLAAWFTQDTVNISEWGGVHEHNKNRRGYVAFGDTTAPASMPSGGTATYTGVVRGRVAANGVDEPAAFTGQVTVVVNFASRTVTVSLQNTGIDLTATAALASGGNANYLAGPAGNGWLSGGLAGRFFGPVSGGGSGTGPAEVGGAFTLTHTGSGAIAIGGFIAMKQ